ncbi:hypothetical protein ACFL6I_15955 [candidate division KSB1 bacterium]
MYIFFLILNKEEYLDEVLEAYLELGVRGATVIESVGMGQILSVDIPIFAGLRDLLPGSRPYNKTIFTITEEDMIPQIITAVEQIIGPLDKPGTGIVFSIKLDTVKGIAPEL